MPTHPPCPVYAITDCDHLQGEALFTSVERLLAAGCGWLQYRDKHSSAAQRLQQAQTLGHLCRHHGAQLIINDDIALARAVDAAGVHLGQSDGSVAEARRQLGSNALIGVTCHHSLSLAAEAVAAGANYLAFGRFFASRTKPEAPEAPMAVLAQARQSWPRQTLVAIGGITRHNAPAVLAQGADLVAICHDLFHCPDPADYLQALASPRVSPTV